jgi:hypothetical protein
LDKATAVLYKQGRLDDFVMDDMLHSQSIEEEIHGDALLLLEGGDSTWLMRLMSLREDAET